VIAKSSLAPLGDIVDKTRKLHGRFNFALKPQENLSSITWIVQGNADFFVALDFPLPRWHGSSERRLHGTCLMFF